MKKIILAVLCLMLGLIADASPYWDVDDSHWAYKQIQIMTNDGVVKGYPNGTFRPDNPITRAEFATMVIRALNQQNSYISGAMNFKDLKNNHWAWDNIQRAVYFDLVMGTPDGYFLPNANVTNAQTLAVAVNALSTRNISDNKAIEVLSRKYVDLADIPRWLLLSAGKAEILDMIVTSPYSPNRLNPNAPTTRAEAAIWLYNMREQAKLNPNAKLAAAMRPRTGDGVVIKNAKVRGSVVTIPAGTKLPVAFVEPVSSQLDKSGKLFVVRVPKNYLTPQKYVILPQNTPIAGQVLESKYGRLFVRNGKLVMETQAVKTFNNQDAKFSGIVDTSVERGFWASLGRAIFKGAKVNFENGQVKDVELLKPVTIDLINGWVIE